MLKGRNDPCEVITVFEIKVIHLKGCAFSSITRHVSCTSVMFILRCVRRKTPHDDVYILFILFPLDLVSKLWSELLIKVVLIVAVNCVPH